VQELLDVIAQSKRIHIGSGGQLRGSKRFPLAEDRLHVALDEICQPHSSIPPQNG